MTTAPHIIQGDTPGPYDFKTDTILLAKIEGDAHACVGATVTVRGMITNDLLIDHGARVYLLGMVCGDITNHGYLHVSGTVNGQIHTRRPAVTEVEPGASVAGAEHP